MIASNRAGLFLRRDDEREIFRAAALDCGLETVDLDQPSYVAALGMREASERDMLHRQGVQTDGWLRYVVTDRELEAGSARTPVDRPILASPSFAVDQSPALILIRDEEQLQDSSGIAQDAAYEWIFERPLRLEAVRSQLRQAIRASRAFAERHRSVFEEARRSRQVLDAVRNGIAICDARLPDLPVVYVNPAFEHMTGYSAEEAWGRNCRFLQSIDTDPQTLKTIRGAIREQREVRVVLKNNRKDGTPCWTELYLSPIFDLSGLLTHFVGIQNDVTMQVESGLQLDNLSQDLAESQLHMQTIFDNMTEGILVLDREGKIVVMNKAVSKLFFVPEGTSLATMPEDLLEGFTLEGEPVPLDQWPRARALRGEFVRDHEMIFRLKATGETGIREITTAPMPGLHGEDGQVIASYRDSSERRRVDEARNRLAAIVESSEDAIIGKDAKGIITSWNRGAEKIFGYTAQEMMGQPIKRLLPADREMEEEEILGRILRDETVDHFDTMRRTKDGRMIHVSLTISPIKDASGKVVGASKIARDITETRSLERQLQQSQKMEAIGQLTGGIAHDFNNLLGIILGNLDLLERLVHDNEAALRRVHTAQKASTRGADLTRRLLAFSSKDALRPKSTLLRDPIQNVIEFAGRALGPEIKITTDLDPSVTSVFVDVAGLESALLNLAINARDAMPKGGSLTIATRLSNLEEGYPPVQSGELKAGRYACISVTDTGHGMSREVVQRAFEPFFSTKPGHQGTGLGLAIVYGFMKQSGGTVRLYSEPGYGTTVSLYLPLVRGHAQSLSAVVEKVLPEKRGGSVLVVDDEEDLLDIAVAYLAEMGYTAYEAKDGVSALEIIERHGNLDLIVTDIIMPGRMNGVELAQRARKLSPRTKVIYCSGFPAGALAQRNMPLVDGPLLRKPFQRAEFGAMVRQVMDTELTNWEQDDQERELS